MFKDYVCTYGNSIVCIIVILILTLVRIWWDQSMILSDAHETAASSFCSGHLSGLKPEAFSNIISNFGGIILRMVTCPVDVCWKLLMDLQWHFPMDFHFCEIWCVQVCPDVRRRTYIIHMCAYTWYKRFKNAYYIYIYMYIHICTHITLTHMACKDLHAVRLEHEIPPAFHVHVWTCQFWTQLVLVRLIVQLCCMLPWCAQTSTWSGSNIINMIIMVVFIIVLNISCYYYNLSFNYLHYHV